ncbi:MAG: hypothetical protein O2795_15040 [Acidobacteria bacterium]|nr:hypothetical protein [Acidobacteriota bacterium]
MKNRSVRLSLGAVIAVVLTLAPILSNGQENTAGDNFSRYARYGADVWARNPSALIAGEGRACISCHTSLPYALVEPLLEGDYPAYEELIEGVNQRITGWSTNTPWYAEEKLEGLALLEGLPPDTLKPLLNAAGSRGPEAIFNALIRATHDAYLGQPAQAETRRAFENMWAEQVQAGPAAGRWRWIQANLVPWELPDSKSLGGFARLRRVRHLSGSRASRESQFAARDTEAGINRCRRQLACEGGLALVRFRERWRGFGSERCAAIG